MTTVASALSLPLAPAAARDGLLSLVASAVAGLGGLAAALEAAAVHGNWDAVNLWRLDDAGRSLTCCPDSGLWLDPALAAYRRASLMLRCPVGSGLPGRAMAGALWRWTGDARSERALPRAAFLPGASTVLNIPLRHGQHRVGVVELIRAEGRRKDHDLAEETAEAMRLVALLLSQQRSEQRLLRFERRSAVAAAWSADAPLLIDAAGTVQETGASTARVVGRGLGKGTSLFDAIHPDDHDILAAALAQAPGADKPVELRVRALPDDGSSRTVRFVVRSLLHDPAVGALMLNASDVSVQQEAQQQLRHDAAHDALTGLVNRSHALESLTGMLASSPGPMTVLFCDLDGFKGVNDTMGHAAGDHVLREVAQRFARNARPGEVVARLGGDEFLLLCPAVTTQQGADARARSVLGLFDNEFALPDGTPLPIGVSVGIAISSAGTAADVLLGHADIAMYEAKRTRSGAALFTHSLLDAHRGKAEMEQDLRSALPGGQMRLLYQPVLNVRTGAIIGSEALLRWAHPRRGNISPSRFVPVAEQIGLIGQLGEFALYGALRQQKAWMDSLGAAAPEFVAVNVSPVQLAAEGFVALVVKALADTGVPATALTLEITESALIDDMGSAVEVIGELADMGIRLDIDDFGTGYSSLAYLVRLPVHALKIDKSFVWGLGNDDKIDKTVKALLNLAHGLGLEAVAEGVESEEQLAWLREHGCDMAQGFFMSKALPGVDFGSLATDQPRW